MKNHLKTAASLALWLGALLVSTSVQAGQTIAEWNFQEPSNATLNTTVNSGVGVGGAGTSWSVAIPGAATTGAGLLAIQNDGKGGSGSRNAYADFGPNFDPVTGGIVSLYTHFAAWSTPAAANPLEFSLGFIEGNDFSTAAFTITSSSNGLTLSANAEGDASALGHTASFNTFQAMTVRLDVDLDQHSYWLGYDLGGGYVSLGSAAIDSFTMGVNSLRMGVNGDFQNNALLIDRVWVVEGATAAISAVPEPGTIVLQLAGLLMVGGVLRNRKPVQADV